MPRSSYRFKQNGSGFVDLISLATNLQIPPDYPGEKHIRGLNFAGPGTHVKERLELPDNNPKKYPSKTRGPVLEKVDAAARKHDISFTKSNDKLETGNISQKEFNDEIEMADDEFIKELASIPDINMTKTLAQKAIILKKYGEMSGLLPRTVFSQRGGNIELVERDIFKPDHYLRKQKKKQKGGLAPLIAGLILTASGVVIDHLLTLIEKKIGGSITTPNDIELKPPNKKTSSDEEKTTYIMHALDQMPIDQQYNLVYKVIKPTI